MLILFSKSQSLLFDAPVQVAQHVRKDGVVVASHTRIQKVAPKRHAAPRPAAQADLFGGAAPAAKPSKLDAVVAKHGGDEAIGRILASLTDEQKHQLLTPMSKVSGKSVDELKERFKVAAPAAPKKGDTPDLFAEPEKAPEPAAAPEPAREQLEMRRDMLETFTQSKPNDPRVEGWHRELESINAKLGNTAVTAHKRDKPDVVDMSGWSDGQKAARALADEWRNDNMKLSEGAALAAFKRKVRAAAKKVPASDEKAVMAFDMLATKVWGTDYNPKVAGLEFKQDERPAEAPAAPSAPFGVPAGITKQQRRDINAKVVAMVTDGRSDPELMRQYSGNGGCGDSLNEFYTDPDVAGSMWSVITRLLGPTGTALEPSCATGVFLHTAPVGYRVTGVEMDPISQACAVALHGDRHEVMPPMSLERFARSDGGRQFKVVVGNPPYGPRGSLAKDDKRDLKSAEAYFIDTALDKCEPGGIVALVVPASVLNNKNGRAFRQRMLCKAEFLGAQRMPNTAFEASHTDVTADVIWLRKRPDDVAGALQTVSKEKLQELGVWDAEFLSGSYFEGRGAGNLFGTAGTAMRAFGEIYTVEGSMAGVAERIAEFEPHPVGKTPTMQDISASLADSEDSLKRAMGAAMVRPYADAKKGDTKVEDGVTYVLQGDPLRWHRVDEVMEHEAVSDGRALASRIESVLAGKADESLHADVQAYIGRHGVPVKNQHLVAAADLDKGLHRLIGAVDRDGRISDAVAGRQEKRVEGSVETAAATLAAEKDDGTFTAKELAERSGGNAISVSDLLHASTAYAYAGSGQWTTMDQYLTGDLWAKLDAARAALKEPDLDAGVREKYELQARRLEETIAPKSLEDVEVTLASGWLPARAIEAWGDSKRDALRAGSPTSEYYRDMKDSRFGFSDGLYSAYIPAINDNILEKYLNRTGLREDDKPAVDRWNDEFKQWLLTSPMRDEVEDLYNRKFRGFVDRKFSQAPIDVPGLDTAGGTRTPNDYHWDSLRWALHNGKGIIADDVGLGKTLRGLMLARLAKLYGKAQKPTFVLPKSVLANWVAEANMWFPGSRILVIGETYSKDKAGNLKSKSDTPEERNRKYHDLTQNDYDFVFVSRDAYNELDVDPETKNQYLGEDFWVQRGDKLGNAGDKRIKKVREQFEQAQADREFGKRTDAIYFNQLPIDMLIMDEGHAYKNLYAARARFGETPKFLGGQGQSNRAFDTGFKTKWLRERNGGKGVFMLTATPTKNSPLEVYSMLSYVAPEEFEKLGIRNSEDFLDRFCEFKSDKVLGTNGAIDDALVTAGFKNLDELRPIMAKYIARRTAEDVGLKIPRGEDHMHLVEMTAAQQREYAGLREMLAESGGKKDATGDAHVFSIMDKMAKAALDLELLDATAHAGAPSPKYEACAAEVAKRKADGGQVIFCESVDSHEKIAAALVKAGIPRERIGIMNAKVASSSAARQNLSDKFNRGDIDVVIGNKVMEEGVNLQKRTSDIHHLDTPWDPATLQQRNGRGVRQGNKREAVRLHTYLARGSFDGYRYQSMRAKRDWMDLLWKGGDRIENLAREGAISRDDIMIAMAADPEAAREKLLNDKTAAMERHAAEKRVESSEQFVRFKSLQRSFKGLKNTDTAAGRRLRAQIEKAKTTLAANPYFKAKSALDSNDEVLIHPGTGDVVQKDQGIEVTEPDGTSSRWVVTGVEPIGQYVSMRLYGDTTGHKGVKVPLMKLAEGTKEFAFDKDAEAAEVGRKMEEAANAKLNAIESYEDVLKMPAAVIEKNHDLLQRQLKEGAKTYKVRFPYGDVPMVDKATGAISMHSQYSAKDKADTHDFWLPSTKNREQAIRQWIDARVKANIGTRRVEAGGRGKHKQYKDRLGRLYDGAKYGSEAKNPHTDVLNLGDGYTGGYGHSPEGPSVKEAKQRMEAEQVQKIRGAKTLSEAMDALVPLGSIGTEKVTYPPRALAMVWAKARQLGALNTPLKDHIPMGYGQTPLHSPHAYNASGEGWDHAAKTNVHSALMRMAAAGSKTHPLALAISRAGARHGVTGDYVHNHGYKAMVKLAEGSRDPDIKAAAYRRALAHAEAGNFADSTKRQVHEGWDGYNYGYGYNPIGAQQKVRDFIADQMSRAATATKEAA